mgnify:CR=1 FL=1
MNEWMKNWRKKKKRRRNLDGYEYTRTRRHLDPCVHLSVCSSQGLALPSDFLRRSHGHSRCYRHSRHQRKWAAFPLWRHCLISAQIPSTASGIILKLIDTYYHISPFLFFLSTFGKILILFLYFDNLFVCVPVLVAWDIW